MRGGTKTFGTLVRSTRVQTSRGRYSPGLCLVPQFVRPQSQASPRSNPAKLLAPLAAWKNLHGCQCCETVEELTHSAQQPLQVHVSAACCSGSVFCLLIINFQLVLLNLPHGFFFLAPVDPGRDSLAAPPRSSGKKLHLRRPPEGESNNYGCGVSGSTSARSTSIKRSASSCSIRGGSSATQAPTQAANRT